VSLTDLALVFNFLAVLVNFWLLTQTLRRVRRMDARRRR